jgi:hypothetical protein
MNMLDLESQEEDQYCNDCGEEVNECICDPEDKED